MSELPKNDTHKMWPDKPTVFPELMTPVEAAMFLRLNEINHTPDSAVRTLNFWRNKGDLKATKYGRHVWYMKENLYEFLKNKTES